MKCGFSCLSYSLNTYLFGGTPKVKWLAMIVMLGAFVFSGFLVFLGMFGNKIALFAGLLGIA